MIKYDYSQPYITRDEYLEVKGIDLNIELQDDDNSSNKVNRFIQDITNFVLDHLVMEYNCNELNRQTHNFEDLAEFRRVRFHYGMLEEIEYVLNNGLIQLDSGINRETGTITDFSGLVIGSSALKQFRLGGFCNKQEGSGHRSDLSPREMPTIEELLLLVSRKVDKVDGKGLSTNDFTTAYKLLLESLSREIENKVEKVVGKVLSSNDFTDELKNKLVGIENNAQVNKIEEIRVNNEPLTITGKAVNISSSGGGGVAYNAGYGVEITDFTISIDEDVVATKDELQYFITRFENEIVYLDNKVNINKNDIQTVLEVALGSTKAFSVNPTTTGNEGFQSGDATITVTSFVDVNGNVVDVTTLKKGDLVFTLNGENVRYADRWLIDPATGAWGLIDADSPNLEGYVTTDTAQTITGLKTFSAGISLGGTTLLKQSSNGFVFDPQGNNRNQVQIYNNALYSKVTFYPLTNDVDVGVPNYRVRKIWAVDLDFSGVLNPNSNGYGFTLPSSSGLSANSELLDTASNQTIPGEKTFSSQINIGSNDTCNVSREGNNLILKSYGNIVLATQPGGNIQPSVLTADIGMPLYKWRDLYLSGNISDGTNSVSVSDISTGLSDVANIKSYLPSGVSSSNKLVTIDQLYAQPYSTNSTTVLEYETINEISVSADTTFTLATAPANTYPEYKANITNSGANAINLTFPSGTVIKTNDTNITIASNVLTLPAGTTIEVNIQNGKMIAFNWSAN